MQKIISTDLWLSRIGLGLIFGYCLLASIFFSYFAQIHLTLRFLPFPIFVGEILLFICLVLFLSVSKDTKLFNRKAVLLLGLYFGWVLVRAFIDYIHDGPLTCRNAALFYYPVFAVFAYCFYQKAGIPRKALMTLAFLAAGIMFFKVMVFWYWWTYVILFVVAVRNTKSVQWRWIGWAFLAVIFFLGKESLYKGERTNFVGVLCSLFFLESYLGALLVKRHDFARAGILLAGGVLFIWGFFIFSERSVVSSLTSLKVMIKTYQEYDRRYQEKERVFTPAELPAHLYNPKTHIPPFSFSSALTSQLEVTALAASQPEEAEKARELAAEMKRAGELAADIEKARSTEIKKAGKLAAEIKTATEQAVESKEARDMDLLKNIQRSQMAGGRTLDTLANNIVFRLFVWRDMARELIQKKAWWGFSFGHPQRSRTLEVLHWAESEWARDGWITPHNSFFHIIYRAGILGVFLVGALFFSVGKLIRDFFIINSIEGGLLVGVLVYWLVVSNFFVILEFPYNAIVFWTLFGITWAYRDGLFEQKKKFIMK